MEKRGLSNLIATVLIVLLALAAVAIVWSFLRPPLEQTGISIGLGTKCIQSEAEPVSCVHNSTSNMTSVNVRLTKGGDVADIIAIVDYQDESTSTGRSGPVQLFATKSVSVSGPAGLNATSARVAPVVGDSEGNQETCVESLVTVPCSVV